VQLIYEPIRHWPPQAWLAECEGATVRIRHGLRVETTQDWFCEAVWAGHYEDGDFDRTDLVAGSGGRLRNGELTFVSSGATVDRLQVFHRDGAALVSNSLVCLLVAAGLSPDPCYSGYYRDFRSIVGGLTRYKRTLQTSGGSVELVYFDNLVWDGHALARLSKPVDRWDFSSFGAYRTFLATSLAAVVNNAGAAARRHPYTPLGTLSSGYDSSAVAVVAREAGVREVLTFDRARGGLDDSGAATAAILGLTVATVGRDAWRRETLPEVPFLAANAYGEEVHWKGAEQLLHGRVLFTGFHGDKVWAKDTKDLGADIVRGDPTGLALTEYRLWAGFLHCPVPFWGVRQIREIHAISHAAEMEPWDVPGDYSRPICRRIVEEAGVPREAFGMRKRAASVVLWNPSEGFLSPKSMEDYRCWLRASQALWIRRGRPPPLVAKRLHEAAGRATARLPAGLRDRLGRLPGGWHIAALDQPYLFRHLFPWAVDRAAARYG